MHIQIEAQPKGGIKIISEIADYKLCRLEGRNGIGKTLAVRLLELATGGRPYATQPAAWRSLRENLGPVDLTVTHLRDGDEVRIRLDPTRWPLEPPNGPSILGTAFLNGHEIDFREIPNTLRVFRISGDESITNEFGRVVETDLMIVERQNRKLDQKGEHLSVACEKLLSDTEGLSPTAFDDLELQHRDAVNARTQAARQYELASEFLDRLQDLDRSISTLEALKDQLPNVDEELHVVEGNLSTLLGRRDSLEEQQRLLLPNAERQRQLLEEMQRLSREREKYAEQAKAALARANERCKRLRIPADSSRLQDLQQQASIEREERLRDKKALLTPPNLVALIGRMRTSLKLAADSNLDDEIVAALEPERRVSVRQLRAGLDRREAEIEEYHETTLVEDLNKQLIAIDEHIRYLRDTDKLLKEASSRGKQVDKLESDIATLSHQLEANRDDDYRVITQELQRVQQSYDILVSKRAELRVRRDLLMQEGSIEKLSKRIMVSQGEMGIVGRPMQEIQDAQVELGLSQNRLRQADENQRRSADAIAALEQGLYSTIVLLEQSSDYEWLRMAVPNLIPTTTDDSRRSLSRIATLDRAVRQIRSDVNVLLTENAPRVIDALRTLARHRGLLSERERVNRYLAPLAAHYEEHFGNLLSHPEIQSALFEGGRFLRLDLERWEIIWEGVDGDLQQRPLEAFSSGERAFAYVLASLLLQESQTTKNRLLVLDEFGAFIEAGRLNQLLNFLRDRVLGPGRVDQVLIVLPLREVPGDATEGTAADFKRSVAERDYYMEEVFREALV